MRCASSRPSRRWGQGAPLRCEALAGADPVLDDGRLEIDNGVAERALRGVAVGRRNWLFAGSLAGGERAAALYTVIETAKANGLEPQAYIADVLAKLAGTWPAARWDELMPWNWRPEARPLGRAA